ncbi:MAG: endonuclease III domain-containing protein [Gammaproteobacteria bacterium]|nr:endonuclease III domain-containing protein [Gammaproteobacteria bacterium]
MKRNLRFQQVYNELFAAYGKQYWWPGETPFEVMVGAILTQNTAWINVEKAIANLKQADQLDPQSIVDSEHDQLALWLQPSGYFNIKAKRLRNYCLWYLDVGGYASLCNLDDTTLRKGLLSVNGVGPETADDIMLYAFERPWFVVDAYTKRLFSRLGLMEEDISYQEVQDLFHAHLNAEVALFNEYHALIVMHCKDVCRKKPLCQQCVLRERCPVAQA